jgi:hypothetical protein
MLLAFVLLPLAFLKACQWANGHPSDRRMEREFRQQRRAFTVLLGMMRHERHVTRVADDFIWIDGAHHVPAAERARYLPDRRLAEYRRLFRTLKLDAGTIRYEDGSIGFLRSSEGSMTSGSTKEFLWSPRKDEPVLAASDRRSLEQACVPETGCRSTRRIGPNWYVSFESH